MPERFIAGFVEGMGDQEDVFFWMTPPPIDLYELVGRNLKKRKGGKKRIKRKKSKNEGYFFSYRTSELQKWIG